MFKSNLRIWHSTKALPLRSVFQHGVVSVNPDIAELLFFKHDYASCLLAIIFCMIMNMNYLTPDIIVVPACAEWWSEADNQATPLSATVQSRRLAVLAYCTNACPRQLEETLGRPCTTFSRAWNPRTSPEWNNQYGSESSSLHISVCIWCWCLREKKKTP